MSHQTGISASVELTEVFRDARTSAEIRTIKISIVDEQLVCDTSVTKQSDSWQDDFDDSTTSLLKENSPCYLLVMLSKKDEWAFITYSPDEAPTREKMIYAATRATMKSEFGGTYIKEEVFTTTKDEVTLSGFLEFIDSKNAPPPLTGAEEELKEQRECEEQSGHGVSTKQKTVGGIAFPITDDADEALNQFKQGNVNHIELNVDVDKELIYKQSSGNVEPSSFNDQISKERASYHVYNYAHQFNDEDMSSTFFVYSMPGYSVPIKARMLYSSCKGPLIETLEANYSLKIDQKIECDINDVLSEDFLYKEVHPAAVQSQRTFTKPKAPGRKGPSRRPRRPAAQTTGAE